MSETKHSEVILTQNVGDVEKATVQVLDTIFEKLATQGTVKGDSSVRLFFPNGIELISAQLTVSPTTGISVDVKIAGEKGIKENKQLRWNAPAMLHSQPPVIRSIQPDEVPLAYMGPVMIVGENFDVGSFALFDGVVPKILKQSFDQLIVLVDPEITTTLGTKKVLVHNSEGDESSEATFEVKGPIPDKTTSE